MGTNAAELVDLFALVLKEMRRELNLEGLTADAQAFVNLRDPERLAQTIYEATQSPFRNKTEALIHAMGAEIGRALLLDLAVEEGGPSLRILRDDPS